MPSVSDVIIHCQKQIKKEPPEEKLLHYLSRLNRLRVALQDLMDTGVGRTVNQLSRHKGRVGHVARKLVKKWKAMVSDENSDDSEDDSRSSSSSGDDAEEETTTGPGESKNIEKSLKHGIGHRRGSENLEGLPHRLNGADYPEDPDSDISDRLCIADEDAGVVSSQDSINIVIKKENLEFLRLPSNSSVGSASEEEHSDKSDILGATQPLITHSNAKLDIEQDYNSSNNNNREKAIIPNKSSLKRGSSESEGESSSEESHLARRAAHEIRSQNKKHLDEFNSLPRRMSNGSKISDDQFEHHQKFKRAQPESDDDRENKKSLQSSGQHQIRIKKELEEQSYKDHHKHQASTEVPRGNHSSKEHRSESRDHKEKYSKDRHSKREIRKDHKNPETRDFADLSSVDVKIKSEPNKDLYDENLSESPVKGPEESVESSSKLKDTSSRKDEKERRHSKHKHKVHRDKEKHRSKERHESREGRRKHEKGAEKHKRKSSEGKEKTRSKSSSSPDHKKPKLESDSKKHKDRSSSKSKKLIPSSEEIDCTSGVNFGDALGCIDTSRTKGSSSKSNRHSVIPQTVSSSRKAKEETKLVMNDLDKGQLPEDKKKKTGMKQLESVIAPTLNISPFYKPSATATLLARPMSLSTKPNSSMASLNLLEQCDPGNYWEDSRISLSHGSRENADDALATMMSSRNQRTKVYSGVKVTSKGEVPRLFDLSMQVIQENIQDLGYTGGVPYDILKPALERATAQQLFQIEECNPYLIGETDELWKFHSKREFRGRDPQELESWRELYERCIFERDEKFAIVRKKMLKKGQVAEPARKAKLAYVEPVGGPRFNRHKATTIKNGMKSLKIKEEKGPKKGVGTSASASFNNPIDGAGIVEEHAVIINPDSRAGHAARPPVSRESTARVKPRRAPLMAKTMKFIKTLTRR